MMYKRPALDELAGTLGIKAKVLEADIRDLAWLWETTIEEMDLHNPLSALDILHAIAKPYIRGRNCRMGSYQTLWKHLPTKAAVMYHLARYVSEENATEVVYAHFPHLRDCGVTSVDKFLSLARELSMKRDRQREEEEMRKVEEARKTGRQKVKGIIENLRAERQRKYDILGEIRRLVDGDERR